jgi:hypothetical protein
MNRLDLLDIFCLFPTIQGPQSVCRVLETNSRCRHLPFSAAVVDASTPDDNLGRQTLIRN